MEKVSSFFKVENDIFYQVGKAKGVRIGEKQGEENKSNKIVKNLLAANQFTIIQIANFANVTEDFVLKVQKSLA